MGHIIQHPLPDHFKGEYGEEEGMDMWYWSFIRVGITVTGILQSEGVYS
jgi:hypothetical protein